MAIEVPELVKTYLRAVLLSATKGKGIPEKELERDYKKMAGETLKWKELGFAHLFDFLEAVPDVARMEWSDKDNQNRVFGVGDPNAFFMSLHAQKAQGKPNSAKPPKTPEMQRKMVGAAAPKSPGRHVSPEGFVAGPRGLYAIYINNLPPGCHQRDINQIFSSYKSLKETKVLDHKRPAVAFAKFSCLEGARKALLEKNGFVLKDCKLTMKPATESQAGGVNKTQVPLSKPQGAVSASLPSSKPPLSPTEFKLPSNASFGVKPSSDTRGSKGDVDGVLEKCVTADVKAGGAFPIHVSNYPPGTSKDQLVSLFKDFGRIRELTYKGRFCFIYFAKKEEAIAAIKNMQNCRFGSKYLTVTPRTVGQFSTERLEELQKLRKPTTSTSKNTEGVPQASDGHPPVSPTIQEPMESTQNDTGYSSGGSNGNAGESTDPSPRKEFDATVYLVLTKSEMDRLLTSRGQWTHPAHRLKDQFDVLVTEIVDCCYFWANADDGSDSYQRLEELRSELQVLPMTGAVPKLFDLGAARYTDDDFWYRCWCLEISEKKKQAKVIYVDYGNAEWIPFDRFASLEEKYWTLQPQGVLFRLAALEPCRSNSDQVQGRKLLSSLILNKVCVAKKCANRGTSTQEPHIIEVELREKDAEGNRLPINLQMFQSGFARVLPASLPQANLGTSPDVAFNRSLHQAASGGSPPPNVPSLEAADDMNLPKVLPASPTLVKPRSSPGIALNTSLQQERVNEMGAVQSASSPSRNTAVVADKMNNNCLVKEGERQPAPTQSMLTTCSSNNTVIVQDKVSSGTGGERQLDTSQGVQTSPTNNTVVVTNKKRSSGPLKSTEAEPCALENTTTSLSKNIARGSNKDTGTTSRKEGGESSALQGFSTSLVKSDFESNTAVNISVKEKDGDVSATETPHKTISPECKSLFAIERLINVSITWVESPDQFYCCPVNDDQQKQFDAVRKLLQSVDVNRKVSFPLASSYACLVSPTGRRRRVEITSTPQLLPGTGFIPTVWVFHLDSGKKQMAPLDNLVELPQHLRAIPRLTRPTKLAGIKPCGLCWSPSALAVLRGMKDRVLQANVVREYADGVIKVELFHDGKSLTMELVNGGQAELTDELQSRRPSFSGPQPQHSQRQANLVKMAEGQPKGAQETLIQDQQELITVRKQEQQQQQQIGNSFSVPFVGKVVSGEEDWDREIEFGFTKTQTASIQSTSKDFNGTAQEDSSLEVVTNYYMPPTPPSHNSPVSSNTQAASSSLSPKTSGYTYPLKSQSAGYGRGVLQLTTSQIPGSVQKSNDQSSTNIRGATVADSLAAVSLSRVPKAEGKTQTVTDKEFYASELAKWEKEKEEYMRRTTRQRDLLFATPAVASRIALEQQKERLKKQVKITELENRLLLLKKEQNELLGQKLKLEQELL